MVRRIVRLARQVSCGVIRSIVHFPSVSTIMTAAVMRFMDTALDEAVRAGDRGEVPVGAVIVDPCGQVIARCGNRMRELSDPTAHAEMLAIRSACAALASERLSGCALYVTLEPCAMCAAAISFARIARVCFGAGDPKGGGIDHGPRFFAQPTCHHVPEVVSGIGESASAALLVRFFKGLRERG